MLAEGKQGDEVIRKKFEDEKLLLEEKMRQREQAFDQQRKQMEDEMERQMKSQLDKEK